MKINKLIFGLILSLFMFAVGTLNATTVKPFNLDEMTTSADKIFRGKVVKIETGTIDVGGGTLSTVSYTLRVSELFKGDLSNGTEKTSDLITLKMIGVIKRGAAKNGIRYVGGFKPPHLINGREYLLFTTPASQIGLTMTVGVGQGVFSLLAEGKVSNEYSNAGLLRNMENPQNIPSNASMTYEQLVSQIKLAITN